MQNASPSLLSFSFSFVWVHERKNLYTFRVRMRTLSLSLSYSSWDTTNARAADRVDDGPWCRATDYNHTGGLPRTWVYTTLWSVMTASHPGQLLFSTVQDLVSLCSNALSVVGVLHPSSKDTSKLKSVAGWPTSRSSPFVEQNPFMQRACAFERRCHYSFSNGGEGVHLLAV